MTPAIDRDALFREGLPLARLKAGVCARDWRRPFEELLPVAQEACWRLSLSYDPTNARAVWRKYLDANLVGRMLDLIDGERTAARNWGVRKARGAACFRPTCFSARDGEAAGPARTFAGQVPGESPPPGRAAEHREQLEAIERRLAARFGPVMGRALRLLAEPDGGWEHRDAAATAGVAPKAFGFRLRTIRGQLPRDAFRRLLACEPASQGGAA